MNIEEVVDQFDSLHTRKYTATERQKIRDVVRELGVVEFTLRKGLISGVDADLGIHRTMIVSGVPFQESHDRGVKPYPNYPHFYAFSNFSGKTSGQRENINGVLEVLCSTEFVWVPVLTECRCGEFHEAE